jgi:magnesium-transporting ATPase (P-type)
MGDKAKNDKLQFSGSSQDEITFLEMCRDVGFCSFIERDSNMITINIQGEEEKYQILRCIDFTSDRKKMSVIVKRLSDGKVVSYIKGADGFINLNEESDAESSFVKEKLNDYASMGLRTLMFCKKDLGSENDEASVREMEATELENDATVLGITALEDLL